MTFDKVAIDVIFRDTFFRPSGLVYVALSRCKTWKGVVLNRLLNRKSIHVDTRVVEFARQTTPSTLIDDAINNGKADSLYRESRKNISEGNADAAVELFTTAIKLRNDIETDSFKRFALVFLNRINISKQLFIKAIEENKILTQKNQNLNDSLDNALTKIQSLSANITKHEQQHKDLNTKYNAAVSLSNKLDADKTKLNEQISGLINEIIRLQNLSWVDKIRGKK